MKQGVSLQRRGYGYLGRKRYDDVGFDSNVATRSLSDLDSKHDIETSAEAYQMSMALWVFSNKRLASIAEWQAAIDTEGYPLRLSNEAAFDELDGFLPMQLRGEQTGFECYRDDPQQLEFGEPYSNIARKWKFALGLRWVGSSLNELRAAWMAATAYASATEGKIFDDQEGKLRSAAEARPVVASVEREPPNTDHVVDLVLRKLKLGPYRET